MQYAYILILLATLLSGGCSDSEFSGNAAPKVEQKRIPKKAPPKATATEESYDVDEDIDVEPTTAADTQPAKAPVDDTYAADTLEERADKPLCSKVPLPRFSFATGIIMEPGNAGAANNWVIYSDPVTIDLSQTEGKFLPISQYSIDDVVFVIGTGETLQVNDTGDKTIHFSVPKGAKVMSDGTANGQGGFLTPWPNVLWTKVYEVNGQTITVPFDAPTRMHVNDLKVQGMPVIPYDQMKISDLARVGLVDDKGILSLKFALVPHGGGFLNIDIDLRKCP